MLRGDVVHNESLILSMIVRPATLPGGLHQSVRNEAIGASRIKELECSSYCLQQRAYKRASPAFLAWWSVGREDGGERLLKEKKDEEKSGGEPQSTDAGRPWRSCLPSLPFSALPVRDDGEISSHESTQSGFPHRSNSKCRIPQKSQAKL